MTHRLVCYAFISNFVPQEGLRAWIHVSAKLYSAPVRSPANRELLEDYTNGRRRPVVDLIHRLLLE